MNPDKNHIAATLAIIAVLGFLAVFFFLAFAVVKPENKDFFNMGFIALINFAGLAFGYYLGSSVGSVQKNDLLAKSLAVPAITTTEGISLGANFKGSTIEEPKAPAEKIIGYRPHVPTNSGFARLPLLMALAAIGLLLLSACTTISAQYGDMSISRTAFGVNLEVPKLTVSKAINGTFSVELEGAKSDSAQAIQAAVMGAVEGMTKAAAP